MKSQKSLYGRSLKNGGKTERRFGGLDIANGNGRGEKERERENHPAMKSLVWMKGSKSLNGRQSRRD